MTTKHEDDANRKLVLTVMNAVFVKRDPQSVLHHFAEGYVQHNPLIPNGRDAISLLISKLPESFRYEVGIAVSDSNLVMVHGRYVGWGPKPMIGVDIFRLSEGLLVEHWDVLQEEIPADQSVNGNAMFG